MSLADSIVDSIEAVRADAGMFAPLRIRLSYKGFSTLVNEAAPPIPNGALGQLGGKFAAIDREQWQYREDWMRRMFEAWGKEGSMLWGYPILCDPDWPHEYQVEVAK